MHSDNDIVRIERYLDEQLGVLSRFLPWREELAAHLLEGYEKALAIENDPATAWKNAVASFGDVNEIAAALRREHRPTHLALRTLTVLAAAALVNTAARLTIFIHIPTMALLLLPVFVGALGLALRGIFSWTRLRPYALWGAITGALAGAALTVIGRNDPSTMGIYMAMSMLAALYGTILVLPGVRVLGVFFLVCTFDMLFVSWDFMQYGVAPEEWAYLTDLPFVYWLRLVTIMAAGLAAGWARFGLKGLQVHWHHIAVGVCIVHYVSMLAVLDRPMTLGTTLVFGSLPLALCLFPFRSNEAILPKNDA